MFSQSCRKIAVLARPLCSQSTPKRLSTPAIKMLSTNSAPAVEQKVEVDGVNINYLKVGNGPHHVLCTPGALGSIWTDFTPQVNHMNKSHFTIVFWDPPGYGKSIPPKRDFSPGFYHRDADVALQLMQKLGIEKYSLVGWSNGGIVSIIMAGKCPDKIRKLVVWGSNTYTTEDEARHYLSFRDPSSLSSKVKAPYIAVYGEERYNELWSSWIDATADVATSKTKGDICTSSLPKISCPLFVLHGRLDFNVSQEHHEYIIKHVKNSRLHVYEEGKHHIHVQYMEDFNKLVENFLLEESPQSKL